MALLASEDIRSAIFTKLGEVGVSNLRTQYRNDVIAADIVLAVMNTA